jgi:hypothetical protein
LEAAAVLIGIQVERTQPLAGTAAAKQAQPLSLDGWLELLRVAPSWSPRRRGRGGGPGGGAPASKPDGGWQPAGSRIAGTSGPLRNILGWVLEAAHRLGAGIPELNTTDLDAAARIVAERARSTGIAVVEACTTPRAA